MTGIVNVLAGATSGLWGTKVNFTVTAANGSGAYAGYVGYVSGSFGSLSGTLPSGKTVAEASDINGGGFQLQITGLSSDPGKSSLVAVAINGKQFLAGASSYGYSAGAATWTWTSKSGMASPTAYPMSIYKNTSAW